MMVLSSTKMLPEVTDSLRKWLMPHERSLWGQEHTVTPELVPKIFGDGAQIIGLSPLNTRPNYYVVRIDSGWSTNNHDWDKPVLIDHLEEIYEAIEEHFGCAHYGDACDCWDGDQDKSVECLGCDDCGCQCGHACPVHHGDWPAFDDDIGCEWFYIAGRYAHGRYRAYGVAKATW